MLYTYKELLNEYRSQYNITKLLAEKKIFKVDEKIYSDKEQVSKLAILSKRYPEAIMTMNSAYYYYSLTDEIPTHYHMVSKRNGTKIKDKQVIQTFESLDTFEMGKQSLVVRDAIISIYSKERMLIELIRNRNKLPFDYYKEIVLNYRRLTEELDVSKIEEYTSFIYRGEYIMEALQMEVF